MRARKLVAALSVYSMLLSQVPFEGITALTANLAPDVPVAVAQTTSSGDFQFEQLSLGSKYQITWLTTITCRNPNGTTQTYLGLDGRGILVELGIPNLVAKAIRDKNLNYTQPTKPLVSSRGGGGGGNRWTIGTPEVETLNAVCKILGSPQDTYVSFDCHDGERGQYPAGKCNYHSPADDPPNDDKMMRFVGPFVIPQCQDGIDNDGDGKTDFPQDPGCSNNQDDDEGPFNAQCGDGIDNDGDGAVDYPNDFSCSSRTDDDETNPKSQCQDGVDNDGDGKTDFPQDPGCSSKQDNDEGPFNGQCGDGIDNDGDGAVDYPNDFSCSSSTDDDETNPKAQCQDGIDNDGDGKTDFPQDPGCSNNQDDDEGPFNAQCGDGIDNDGDGATDFPNDFSCSSTTDDDETNPKSQCQDGIDNDGDGKIDFSQDPGCSSKQDNDEGPFNTQCNDGIDNDGDGKIDFPQDPDCTAPTDSTEVAQFDLNVQKQGPATIAKGGTALYTLQVTNVGPDTVSNAIVQDIVTTDPVHIIPVFVVGQSSQECVLGNDPQGRRVDCTLSSLPAGQSKTFTVAFAASGNIECGTDVVNTAHVPRPDGSYEQGNIVRTRITCAQCS